MQSCRLLFFICLTIALLAIGQSVCARSVVSAVSFDKKTMKVGEPVKLTLILRRPANLKVSVRDTDKHFAPFELKTKFPVRKGRSVDTLTYELVSFELDSVQKIRLAYFYTDANGLANDTTPFASIRFQSVALPYTDQMQYKINSGYAPIPKATLSRSWGWLIAAILVGLAAIVFILWRPIRKMIEKRRLRREWLSLIAQMENLKGKTAQPTVYIGEINRLWKLFLDKTLASNGLKTNGFTLGSLTTAELSAFFKQTQPKIANGSADFAVFVEMSSAEDKIIYARQNYERADLELLHAGLIKQLTQIFEFESRKK